MMTVVTVTGGITVFPTYKGMFSGGTICCVSEYLFAVFPNELFAIFPNDF